MTHELSPSVEETIQDEDFSRYDSVFLRLSSIHASNLKAQDQNGRKPKTANINPSQFTEYSEATDALNRLHQAFDTGEIKYSDLPQALQLDRDWSDNLDEHLVKQSAYLGSLTEISEGIIANRERQTKDADQQKKMAESRKELIRYNEALAERDELMRIERQRLQLIHGEGYMKLFRSEIERQIALAVGEQLGEDHPAPIYRETTESQDQIDDGIDIDKQDDAVDSIAQTAHDVPAKVDLMTNKHKYDRMTAIRRVGYPHNYRHESPYPGPIKKTFKKPVVSTARPPKQYKVLHNLRTKMNNPAVRFDGRDYRDELIDGKKLGDAEVDVRPINYKKSAKKIYKKPNPKVAIFSKLAH